MILKETILSAFTERGTLLKWLKKVEAALNNAVLTDISIEQVSETQVKLKFTFENGDFVESPILTLPKGKDGTDGTAATVKIGRVISAEPNVPPDVINTGTDTNAVLDFIIPKGKDGLDGQGIAATIEVGTVTTGAAGTNASVTNVGTEQRAVLNFVIPRGDTGATGEAGADGSAGVGFEDADEISINDGAINITAGDNGVNIEATFEVAVGEEVLEIPSTMYLPLKGSESIVIDVDESGDFIDIHLDANIVTKLSRVLMTPMSAPASVSLVGVDTSNAQTMLTLGSGLSVENGVISASGGGGNASGFFEISKNINGAYINIRRLFDINGNIMTPVEMAFTDEELSALCDEETSGSYIFKKLKGIEVQRSAGTVEAGQSFLIQSSVFGLVYSSADNGISPLTSTATKDITSLSTSHKLTLISICGKISFALRFE